jgi:hypothetical protein
MAPPMVGSNPVGHSVEASYFALVMFMDRIEASLRGAKLRATNLYPNEYLTASENLTPGNIAPSSVPLRSSEVGVC